MEKQINSISHFVHFDRLNSISDLPGSVFDNTLLEPKDYCFSSFYVIINQSKSPNNSNWINDFVFNDKIIIEHGDEEFITNLNNLKYCFDKIDENKIVKEIIFENVRRTNYSDKPSRFSSLFIADVVNAEQWGRCLINSSNLQSNLITLELIQKKHLLKVYPSFLLVTNDVDLIIMEDAAHLYWMGKLNPILPNSLPEYLFVGKAIVLNKLLMNK